MSADPTQQVFQMIDARRDELIELTRELIRFPTVNPPGDAYQPCAEFIGRRLRERGFAVQYVHAAGAPGDTMRHPRINVVARREGDAPGPCVHFNSHIDVVQTGAGWTLDPFAAIVQDGMVYGRGACDMKGGLAASIIAVEALIDCGAHLQGTLEISGTVDEETGGFGGVHYLAQRGWFSPGRVDHVIIPEPLNVDRVCIGHRGVWWAEIIDQLEAARISWKVYAEDIPSTCSTKITAGAYVRRHVPFHDRDVADNPKRCQFVVSTTTLTRDLAEHALPRFVWLVPNICHDMHSCDTYTGDRYLRAIVPRLLAELGPSGLLFVTFDEGSTNLGCCGVAKGGHILTLVAGPGARAGVRSDYPHHHYSLLRTIEDLVGTPETRGSRVPFHAPDDRSAARAPAAVAGGRQPHPRDSEERRRHLAGRRRSR